MSIRAHILSLKGLLRGLSEEEVADDPFVQFKRWFAMAKSAGLCMPESFMLATVNESGQPSARMLLMKGFDASGFTFYTNYNSRKCVDLAANPNVAMVFHWNQLFRQIRVEGCVTKLSGVESDAYFNSRARGSQIGAWSSPQSSEIESRRVLQKRVDEYTAKFKGQGVPRPEFWGGYRVCPHRIEFWQGRPYRLHDRICFMKEGDRDWRRVRLAP